jgi:hypothetical protein
MDTPTLQIVSVFVASVISAGLAFLASMYVNKKKMPVDIAKEKTEISLNEGGLAEKYHSLANLQADENIELTNQNMELKRQIDNVRVELLEMDRKHVQRENELEAKLEEEVKKRLIAEDYIRRLLYQFKSWNITPVPYDVEDVKEQIKQACIEGDKQRNVTL